MKLIWYIVSICTILLILINNPKATSLGNFGNQGQVLNVTRGAQRNLQLITVINVIIFFILTIFIVIYSL